MGFAVTLKWAPPQPVIYAANRSVARAHLTQIEHEIAEQEWQLQFQVRNVHSLLLMLRKELHLCDELLARRQKILESYKTRLEQGSATRIEINQVRLALLSQRRDCDNILLREVDSQTRLRALLGSLSVDHLSVTGSFSVFEKSAIPDADSLAELALSTRPALKAAQAKLVQRQQLLKIEKARRWPWFELSTRYRHTSSTNYPNEILVGIETPLAILDWNRGPIREAAAQVDLALGLAEAEFLALKQNVYNAHAALVVSRNILHRYEHEVIPILSEHEQLLEFSVRAGQMDVVTLLVAEETVLRARRDYFEARLAFRQKWLALEAAVGKRLVEDNP